MEATIFPVKINKVWEKQKGEPQPNQDLTAELIFYTQGETQEVGLTEYPWLYDYCTDDSGCLNLDSQGKNVVAVLNNDGRIVFFDRTEESVLGLEEVAFGELDKWG